LDIEKQSQKFIESQCFSERENQKSIPLEKINLMKKTSLQDRKAIEAGLKDGKSYALIANEQSLSLRVVRKWGQIIKKGVH
jgi:hypothetical protein